MQKGAGDFIGGMKFCPTDVSKIFIASGDGTISLQSFEGSQSQILSRTPDCGHDHHDLWWGQCLYELFSNVGKSKIFCISILYLCLVFHIAARTTTLKHAL